MGSGTDSLIVDVLPDGTIRVSTDEVSDTNHMNAEKLLRFLAEEMGVSATRVKRGHAHSHTHDHEHGHEADRQKARG